MAPVFLLNTDCVYMRHTVSSSSLEESTASATYRVVYDVSLLLWAVYLHLALKKALLGAQYNASYKHIARP
jgi:hypothetical protein